jgi:threonyl-tRNA synthetase
VARQSVSFRYRNGQQRNFVPLDEAVRHVVDFIASRDNREPSAEPAPAQGAVPGS